MSFVVTTSLCRYFSLGVFSYWCWLLCWIDQGSLHPRFNILNAITNLAAEFHVPWPLPPSSPLAQRRGLQTNDKSCRFRLGQNSISYHQGFRSVGTANAELCGSGRKHTQSDLSTDVAVVHGTLGVNPSLFYAPSRFCCFSPVACRFFASFIISSIFALPVAFESRMA